MCLQILQMSVFSKILRSDDTCGQRQYKKLSMHSQKAFLLFQTILSWKLLSSVKISCTLLSWADYAKLPIKLSAIWNVSTSGLVVSPVYYVGRFPLRSKGACGSKTAIKSFEIEVDMSVMRSFTFIQSSFKGAAVWFFSKLSRLVLTCEIDFNRDWKANAGPAAPYPLSSWKLPKIFLFSIISLQLFLRPNSIMLEY